MTFTAVILAGGRSSRMGRDKAFLTFQGKPLIEHALQLVRDAGADEVLISGRPEQDFSAYNCPGLLDLKPDCGPLGGIERGLHAATHPMVLLLAVDLPHMTGDCLRWLTSATVGTDTFPRVPDFRDENGDVDKRVPTGSGTGAVPTHDGQLEPLVACYLKAAHEIVIAMLREKQFAAREFAARCTREGLARTLEVPVEHTPCFRNWNSPEDLD